MAVSYLPQLYEHTRLFDEDRVYTDCEWCGCEVDVNMTKEDFEMDDDEQSA